MSHSTVLHPSHRKFYESRVLLRSNDRNKTCDPKQDVAPTSRFLLLNVCSRKAQRSPDGRRSEHWHAHRPPDVLNRTETSHHSRWGPQLRRSAKVLAPTSYQTGDPGLIYLWPNRLRQMSGLTPLVLVKESSLKLLVIIFIALFG